MIPEYDVLVVGAGPAGSVAARQAAAGGASTLILEKSGVVGEPVRCGEFMPSREEIHAICDELPEEELFDLPGRVIGTYIEGARAYAPSGKSYEIPFSGYSIWRDKLDQHLAREAVGEGAILRTDTPFLGFSDGKGVTPRGPVSARVVIGADGPHSAVRRASGLPEPETLFPALSVSVDGSFDPVFEAFFGPLAPGGYAWIIPRREDANVGLGVKPELRGESLQEALRRFLRLRGLETDRTPCGGFVPMSGPLPTTVKGNVLLVGDSAGQVLSTSGGGIFTSMICGYYAGQAAAQFVKGRGPLEDYERWWRKSVGAPLERGRALFQAMSPAFDDPETLEELFRLQGPEGLLAFLRCQTDEPRPFLSLESPSPK